MKYLLLVAVMAVAGFSGMTWWSLESGGVAVLRTDRPDGLRRETRVWFARYEGALWLESATPERAWYLDLRSNPDVSLTIDGEVSRYRAQAMTDPEARRRIRSLLRRKYGVRDWWVGLFQDTSRSVAVRLVP
jgi:hypothetical protein